MFMTSSKAGYIFDAIHSPLLQKIITGIENDGINLNELEFIRMVYVRLGAYLSFNSKYRYLMSASSQLKEETDAWRAIENSGLSRVTSNAICIDIEGLFSTILTEMYAIPSKIVVDGSGPHVYLEIKTEDYGRIYCDLQQDLYNIKLCRKTQYFASTDFYNGRHYSKIPDDELYLIDKKIKYVAEESYSNEAFESRLKIAISSIKNDPVATAVSFFECMNEIYGDAIEKMGYCEASEAYKLLAAQYVSNLHMIHRTLRTTQYDLISYFHMLDSANVLHYFLGDNARRHHIEVDANTIERLEETNRIVHKSILDVQS